MDSYNSASAVSTPYSTRSRGPVARNEDNRGASGTADLAAFLAATGPVEDWEPQENLASSNDAMRKKKSDRLLSKLLKKSTQTFRTPQPSSEEFGESPKRGRSATSGSLKSPEIIKVGHNEGRDENYFSHGMRAHKPNSKSVSSAISKHARPQHDRTLLGSPGVSNAQARPTAQKKAEKVDKPRDKQQNQSQHVRGQNARPQPMMNGSMAYPNSPASKTSEVLCVHDGDVFERVSSPSVSHYSTDKSSSKGQGSPNGRIERSSPRRTASGKTPNAERSCTDRTDVFTGSPRSPQAPQESEDTALGTSAHGSTMKKLSVSDLTDDGSARETPHDKDVKINSSDDGSPGRLLTPRDFTNFTKADRGAMAKSLTSTNAATVSTQKDAESSLAFDPPDDVKDYIEKAEVRTRGMNKTSSLPNLRVDKATSHIQDDDDMDTREPVTPGALTTTQALLMNRMARVPENARLEEDGQDYATAMRQLEQTSDIIMQKHGSKMPASKGKSQINASADQELIDALQKAEERAMSAESAAQSEKTKCRQLTLRSLRSLQAYSNLLKRSDAGEQSKLTSVDSSDESQDRKTSYSNNIEEGHSIDIAHVDKLINDLHEFIEQGRRPSRTPKSSTGEPPSILKNASHVRQGQTKERLGSVPNPSSKAHARSNSLKFDLNNGSNRPDNGHVHKRAVSNSAVPSNNAPSEAYLYAKKIKATL